MGDMNEVLRILFLEDSDADAQLIMRQLTRAGIHFDATRVSARDEYVAALSSGEFDVILADYALPTFDGLAALAIALETSPDVPFIIVSGVLGEERAIETLKAGATDYVLKQGLARLAPAVVRALEVAEVRRARRAAEEGLRRRTCELEEANAELAAHRTQLQDLSRRLVEVQEAERAALGRDLHDTAAQALTAVAMGLGRLARQPDQAEAVRQQVAQLRELTDQVVADLRRLAVNLRPVSLDRYGLVAAVEQYIDAMREGGGLKVDLYVDGLGEERLPAELETALYRIIQEALANVVRHAHASSATVLLGRADGWLTVVVEDNGVGCDVAQVLQGNRLGLLGMRERAQMLGGSFRLESTPGAGSRVAIVVPLEAAPARPLTA